jgi:AcrR family transcriptional regulator
MRTRIRKKRQATPGNDGLAAGTNPASAGGLRRALPTQQARSRRTRDALLDAARTLLNSRAWNELTVADIVEQAGCSVGAFYSRFPDKEALFEALTAQWFEASAIARNAMLAAADPNEDIAEKVVLRAHRSVMSIPNFWRAALVRAAREPEYWEAARSNREESMDRAIAAFESHLGRRLGADERQRVYFAFQMTYGVINNGILNRPGPLMPGTPEFERELVRGFKAVAAIPGL